MASRTKRKKRPRQVELTNRFPYFLLPCHEKLLYLVLIKGAIFMKLKHLFTFITLLTTTSFEGHAAAGISATDIFESTPLPGGLTRMVVKMPEGSNYFTFAHDGSKESLKIGTVTKSGTSLPISYIDDALIHGEGVIEHEGSLHIRVTSEIDDPSAIGETSEIEDRAGTYKSGHSISLTARSIDMIQTGFVWGSTDQDHCMLSAPRDCSSPLRGIELIGDEKDSEGNYRALVYGTLNFRATTLKDTFVSAEYPGTPDAFKGGLTFLGVKAIALIIEGPEA